MSLKNILSKIANQKPSMYSHSLLLNILGMQFFRIFFLYLRRVVRLPKRIHPQYAIYLNELTQNGIVIIPNFFSPDQYALIREEYDRLAPEFRRDDSEIPLPHVDRMNIHNEKISSGFKQLFLQNPVIHSLSVAFLNRKYNPPIDAYLTRIYCNEEELALPKNGGTNNLHFDAPTRVLKAFYYIADADEKNAALKYCKGTHKRNSLSRLFFEYLLSIRYSLNRWNPHHEGEYLDNEPWVKITPAEMLKHDLQESVMAVKGNSMIFVNTGGFHRRGEFLEPGVRKTIEFNYRGIESLRNEFYGVGQKLKQIARS
jgi:hypothetical protein